MLEICRNGVQSIVYNIIFCYYPKWSQSLTTKNSTFTDSNCSLLPGLPTFSKRFRNRRSHTGASCLINLIEPAYPFCSIPPKETENAGRDFEHEDEHVHEHEEQRVSQQPLARPAFRVGAEYQGHVRCTPHVLPPRGPPRRKYLLAGRILRIPGRGPWPSSPPSGRSDR